VSDAPDAKVREECVPGKPMTVFSSSAHKVLVYSLASLLPLHPFILHVSATHNHTTHIQLWTTTTMVNPQLGTPYSTVQVPLYDGDTYMRVADRIRRTSGIPGN